MMSKNINATNRLNLLLSDILQSEPASSSSKNETHQDSSRKVLPSLTFTDLDYHAMPTLPSITAATQVPPLVPRRNPSSIKHHRQRHPLYQSNMQKQQQQQPPLLNSSTLDDLFEALTLECEQYLAASTSSYRSKMSDRDTPPPIAVDSNDDDYENLHTPSPCLSNAANPSLKTSIEVMSPQTRHVLSVSVSTKKVSPSPLVPPSRTYPLLSSSFSGGIPSMYKSSEEDSVNVAAREPARRRRRRTRKSHIIVPSNRSHSSSDEHIDAPSNGATAEKKSLTSKRSSSMNEHRQMRVKSVYDNNLVPSFTQKPSNKRPRRRDISLQQPHAVLLAKHDELILPSFPENLCSPLSVLLTSTRSSSDFVDPCSQQRRARLELIDQPPLTLLDRMHQQFYRSSSPPPPPLLPSRTPTNNKSNGSNGSNNIPSHRIPSFPVY